MDGGGGILAMAEENAHADGLVRFQPEHKQVRDGAASETRLEDRPLIGLSRRLITSTHVGDTNDAHVRWLGGDGAWSSWRHGRITSH